MNKKFLSIILSFAVVFMIVCMNFGNMEIKANALEDNIIDTSYFYIKNVRSGKYLTLQNNQVNDGTLIVQWKFNGGDNQKWKFVYYGDKGVFGGTYQICPYKNLNKAIQMQSATADNGVEARLAPKADVTKQFFRVQSNYTGTKRFVTNASNFTKVLEMNGASVYNNTKLIQYSTVGNGSDQWLVETVDMYNSSNGVYYSEMQADKRIMTYPNFDKCTSVNKMAYQRTNYVSQCLCAAGCHYDNSWYCNKNEFYQPSSFTITDLNNKWSISQRWYVGTYFLSYWKQNSNSTYYGYYTVVNRTDNNNSTNSFRGNAVVIEYLGIMNTTEVPFVGYIVSGASHVGDCIVRYHNGENSVGYDYLRNICEEYSSAADDMTITLLRMN